MASNPTSFRLSDEAKALLDALSKHFGIKSSAVVEIALRKLAQAEGVQATQASDTRNDEK